MATFVVTAATTVRPPAPSDSAVCAKLAFAGYPWNVPAARFATPSARNSSRGSIG